MRKYILVLFVILITFSNTYAQLAGTEAKAAYLLAEEAYGKGDWRKTLRYLDECKKKLESTNCKILYLQVMAESEIAKTEPRYYDSALRSIAAFEISPDIKEFTEEKVLEVMKAKYTLREDRDKLIADAEAKKISVANTSAAMKDITWDGLPIGVRFEGLAEKRKAENRLFFEHKTTDYKINDGPKAKAIVDKGCFYAENSPECRGKGLRAVYVQNGNVFGYLGTLDYKSTTVGNVSRATAVQEALKKPDYYTTLFGFQPEVTETADTRSYSWTKDRKTVTLQFFNLTLSKEFWCVYTRLVVIDRNVISEGK